MTPVFRESAGTAIRGREGRRERGSVTSQVGKRSDGAAQKLNSRLACRLTESTLAAAEKCLDEATENCFVVDDDGRLVGSVSLNELREAIVAGVGDLAHHLAQQTGQTKTVLSPQASSTGAILIPVLDSSGRLLDVRIDRSRQFVQIAKPNLSHHELRFLLDAFLSSWISGKGPHIIRFEQEFAQWIGKRHGIAVANGTAALHLALSALGLGPGDEVIVPDLTFAATINAVLYCGATPVIVDVDKQNWTLSVAKVLPALSSRTRAIIPVHLYGRPAEIGPLAALASAQGCFLVEDCAEAPGARYAGRMIGQFSDVSCFSFHSNKVVTTGEGGMCLVDSDSLLQKARSLRDHGMDPKRIYWHEQVGYNYRMTNLQAALGLAQLSRVGEMMSHNQQLEDAYRAHLENIPGVVFPPPLGPEYEPVVWLVSIQVPADRRALILERARARDVELRPFFHPLSTMPLYCRYSKQPCVNSFELAATGLNLPTSNAVDSSVMEKIADILRSVLG